MVAVLYGFFFRNNVKGQGERQDGKNARLNYEKTMGGRMTKNRHTKINKLKCPFSYFLACFSSFPVTYFVILFLLRGVI